MRYELDANGYVLAVFWGCNSGNCTEYTGKVPSGYKDLTEWSENALINAYYIVDGNLVLDSDKLAELQAIIEQETIDNTSVFYKDIYGTNEVLDSQYQSKTASGQVIAVDNVKRVNPKVKITDIKCYDYDKIDIISQNKNMLSIDTPNEVVKGIKFTKGANGSLNISGKVYKDMPMVEGEENNYSIEGSPTIECTYENLSNESITISDTSLKIEDGKEIESFKVYGKSEQDGIPTPDAPIEIKSISGIENLLNINTFVKGRLDNGVLGYEDATSEMIIENNSISYTTTSKYRGVVSDFIPVNANTTYYLFGEESVDGYEYIDVYNSSKTWISRQSGTRFNKEFTTPSNASYIRFSSQFPAIGTHTISNVMITTSSKNNYVPYGRYLRIDNVGKNKLKNILTSQTINGVTITTYDDGSFLLNGTSTTEFYPTLTNNFKIESGNYTLSSGEAEMSSDKIKMALRQKNQNVFIAQVLSGTSVTFNNTFTDEVFVFLTIRTGQTFDNVLIKPMLEKGSIQTEYEEYKNDVTYVNLGDKKLCSIGNAKDELEVVSGKGVKRIGEVILNGSESGWALNSSASTVNNYYEFNILISNKPDTQVEIISDYFPTGTSYNNSKEQIRNRTDKYIYINILGSRLESKDVTGFKKWLSNNPVTVQYELATPEEFEVEPTDSTETTKYNLSGSSTNTTSIFALKKNENYYLNVGDLDCEMNYYDGTTSQVYIGASGLINLSENKEVTQVLIKLPTYTTINKTIYPQLEYGSVATEYEEHKERRITINFGEFIKSNFIPASETLYVSEDLYPLGTTIEYIYIENGKVYISADGVTKYLMTGNVNLFNGFNTVYTMQDANIEMTYSIDELTGSFTGDVYSTEGNKVVGKYGILTNLQFIGNSFNWYGQHNIDSAGAWFLGFNTELTGSNWANFIKADAYIPEGFKVTEAKLTVVHKPVLWGDDSSVTGYCKNIEAYKISNIKTSTILAAYCSEYDVTSGYTFSKIDNAMGKGGHTFNSTEVETFVSNDISDIFEDINGNTVSGNYQIAIKTRDSVPILSDNPNYWLGKDTGHVYMILNIIGYMPNNTNR